MRLALVYKNFAANQNVSHIGLGVAALNNAKVLRENGIKADVVPVVDAADLTRKVNVAVAAPDPVTHVVTSALWIPSATFNDLTRRFPDVHFAVNSHSNVGFLQADPQALTRLRESLDLQDANWNFHMACNNDRMARWVRSTYASPCAHLPNLYYLHGETPQSVPLWRGGPLRVGLFGAVRPLKNMMSAAAAALQMARDLKTDVELYVCGGRVEGGGQTVLQAVAEMFRGLPFARLIDKGWDSWPVFRRIAGTMHLLLQPSYTESFNMVTADGVSQGVPSVVSDAITWAPSYWRAHMDDVEDIARVGRHLLSDPSAARDGLAALKAHTAAGMAAWKDFLKV